MPLDEPSRETTPFAGAGLEAATSLHDSSSGEPATCQERCAGDRQRVNAEAQNRRCSAVATVAMVAA
jgi:hypothetical protein